MGVIFVAYRTVQNLSQIPVLASQGPARGSLCNDLSAMKTAALSGFVPRLQRAICSSGL